MSKLGKNIEEQCKKEKDELEQCVWTNWSETHSTHNAKK
jgi:hypothetical protein